MNKYIKITLTTLAFLPVVSCSDTYLDTLPQSSLAPATVFADPDAAQLAVNGLGAMMCTQYLSTQGLNGEGTINLYYGELCGDGLQKCDWTGWSNTINQGYNESNSNTNAQFGWYYYYKILGNCNLILSNIPTDDKDNQDGWDYVKAQTLTYRAYSYLRLCQLYGRRWSDKQGQSRGVILRVEPGSDPMAATSLANCYAQIYADLDEAIKLFEGCGYDRGSSLDKRWMANVNVAHAVYSRAAMNRLDWNTAITHAQAARKGYALMSASDYNSGFNEPNSEWIWEAYNATDQSVYYYSFFAYAASNSSASSCRTYPVAIARTLAEAIPENDTRRAVYAYPTESEWPTTASSSVNKSQYFNGSGRATSSNCKAFYNRIRSEYADKLQSTTYIYFYMAFKFQAQDGLGVGKVCLFRSAEMIYNEAEAQYMLGNEAAAKALLAEAVAPYQDNYSCEDLTGEDLFNEIKLYRKFDLWGEGLNFFDLKRRGESMVRKSFAQGGSWISNFSGNNGNYGPDVKNNWTRVYPLMETQYNDLVVGPEPDNWTPSN